MLMDSREHLNYCCPNTALATPKKARAFQYANIIYVGFKLIPFITLMP